jgi:hypothetical protein
MPSVYDTIEPAEVAGEAHVLDHAELVVGALGDLWSYLVVAAVQALLHHVRQVAVERLALGYLVARQHEIAQRQLDVATLGDLESGLARARPAGELLGHLLGRLQVELVGVELEAVRL